MATRPASRKQTGPSKEPEPPRAEEKDWPVAEIVTGIIIVLILGFLGVPKLARWWHEYEINQDVIAFYDNLTMAQNTAVNNRNPVYVTFHPDRNTYTIHEDENKNAMLDDGEFHQQFQLGEHLQYATRVTQDLKDVWEGKPITAGPVHLLQGGHRLAFNALGQASDNATVYLIPKENAGNTKAPLRALQIHKSTGDMHIRHYTGEGKIPWK